MGSAMRRLIDEATWPEYLTTARVVPISKTDSAFPPVGSIRTVAVLPAVTKLMELLVMEELEKGARDRRLIAKEQQGFRKGVQGFRGVAHRCSKVLTRVRKGFAQVSKD